MNQQSRLFFATLKNPIMRALAIIASGGVLVALFALGLMFFAVFAGVALVSGVVLAGRLWWLNRKIARQGGPSAGPLEGDYRVISVTRETRRNRSE